MALERIKFGPGRTDEVSPEMAQSMLELLFRNNRKVFANLARSYYLELHNGPQETAPRAD